VVREESRLCGTSDADEPPRVGHLVKQSNLTSAEVEELKKLLDEKGTGDAPVQ